jgi:hypothetical protein
MAVRCLGCGRLSRDEAVCEWCRTEIPPEARRLTAAAVESREADGGTASGATDEVEEPGASPLAAVDTVSREEAQAAAAVPEEERVQEVAETADPETVVEAIEQRQDRDTLVILLLILVQLALTLYLGRLTSWWSVTGILWLLVGYGVKERASWSLALPLVLFTLDVALLLFGVGPRERAGFPALAPLDFVLYLLRLVIWGLIWRLRDELA